GLVWYRTRVTLSGLEARQAASLALGTIDEVDQTWLNGLPVGTTSGPDATRDYAIPAGLLHAGENVIVVAVLDTYGYGGIYGPPQHRALHLADGSAVALDGDWYYRIVPASFGPTPRAPWEAVTGLGMIYDAMIAPLEPYGLRGVLWYQGESNTAEPERYQRLLASLMADWRKRFGAELPFLIVQLANYGPAATAPAESGWAALREAQRLAVAHDAHAALAVAIDIGDRYDIHPANKQELGRRLARAARRIVYGEAIAPSGPVARSAHRDGSHVLVQFADVEEKLVAYGADHPIGFELCGSDRSSCRYADAQLQSDRVILAVPPGEAPQRVRFCWADSPV